MLAAIVTRVLAGKKHLMIFGANRYVVVKFKSRSQQAALYLTLVVNIWNIPDNEVAMLDAHLVSLVPKPGKVIATTYQFALH